MKLWKRLVEGTLREIIFGLEDGLVSTLGVVTGIASGLENRQAVILSGFILILVEALSMAAGTYLSNKAEIEQDRLEKYKAKHLHPLLGAFVMGITYILGGAVPLAPYIYASLETALIHSVIFTVIVLFTVGFAKSRFTKTPPIRGGLEMVLVSLSAAFLGYLIGYWGSIYLGLPR